MDASVVAEVARLVRLTESHRPAESDLSGCVLSDADLAILAAPDGRYAEYVTAVRREYSHVPERAFRQGRAAILQDLLAKPHLFHTAYAREHWEATARANVRRELSDSPRRLGCVLGMESNPNVSDYPDGRLRRRRPAAWRRRTSSREVTSSTPRATTWSYHSDGTS